MLQHRPLVVACVGFIAGILAAVQFGGSGLTYSIVAVASLAWFAVDSKRALAALLVVWAAIGVVRTVSVTAQSPGDISRYAPAAVAEVSGMVDGEPERHAASIQFVLTRNAIAVGDRMLPVDGRLSVVAAMDPGDDPPEFRDGDRIRFAARLERPRGTSDPGGFSQADSLARRGIWATAHVSSASKIEVVAAGAGGGIASLAIAAREHLLAGMSQALSPRDFAVLGGVLFGIRAQIAPRTLSAFVATGTVHILATAGLHVGVIVVLLGWAGYAFSVPRKWTAAGSMGVLWMYDIMAGGRPAVTRACVVASVYLAATIVERAPDVLTSLSFAALLILFLQPTALLDPGFQMSFCTVLTIIALLPIWKYCLDPIHEKLRYKWKRVVGWGIDLVGLCIAAQIGAGPIVAGEFHILPLWSVTANLIVVPLVFLLVPSGLAVALLSVVSVPVAGFVAMLTVSPLLTAILRTTDLFGSGPGASIAVGDIPGWALVAYYAIVCGGGLIWQERIARVRRLAIHATAVDPGEKIPVASL